MIENKGSRKRGEKLSLYMDLLAHDILNNGQAVLGYLELILANPATDKTVRRYAEKAVAHTRAVTLSVENVKRLLAVRAADPESFKPIDLIASLANAQRELERFFPARKVEVRLASEIKEAVAVGDSAAQGLILNVLASMVRLDPDETVEITVKLREGECNGERCWNMRIEDSEAVLPPVMRGKGVDSLYTEDSSTAVKMAGMMFADMITHGLGGNFHAEELRTKGDKRGVAFTITLRKVDRA